jgi:peptide/nickel transport system permease protein
MRSMRFVRRLIESLLVVWAVATAAFFALRLGRVDPLASLTAEGLATPEQARAMRSELGLDRPLLEQYFEFAAGAARGDLGRSLFSGQEVAAMIREAAGFTVPLAAAAWLCSVAFGIAAGAVASRRGASSSPDRALAGAASAFLAVGASTPVAWSGLMILWASVPLFQAVAAGPLRDALRLILPVGALTLAVGCSIGRAAETAIRESRREAFHLAMRAHGFPRGLRAEWSLLRAAIAPVLTLAGMEAAFLLGGTMVTEAVFSRPGLGRMLVDAALRGDYPVVQALLALAALGYCVSGLLADAAAATLDPRMREGS